VIQRVSLDFLRSKRRLMRLLSTGSTSGHKIFAAILHQNGLANIYFLLLMNLGYAQPNHLHIVTKDNKFRQNTSHAKLGKTDDTKTMIMMTNLVCLFLLT